MVGGTRDLRPLPVLGALRVQDLVALEADSEAVGLGQERVIDEGRGGVARGEELDRQARRARGNAPATLVEPLELLGQEAARHAGLAAREDRGVGGNEQRRAGEDLLEAQALA